MHEVVGMVQNGRGGGPGVLVGGPVVGDPVAENVNAAGGDLRKVVEWQVTLLREALSFFDVGAEFVLWNGRMKVAVFPFGSFMGPEEDHANRHQLERGADSDREGSYWPKVSNWPGPAMEAMKEAYTKKKQRKSESVLCPRRYQGRLRNMGKTGGKRSAEETQCCDLKEYEGWDDGQGTAIPSSAGSDTTFTWPYPRPRGATVRGAAPGAIWSKTTVCFKF